MDIIMIYLELASFIVSFVLMFMSAWAAYWFMPDFSKIKNSPQDVFLLAVSIGFAGVCLNVFYWRVVGDALIYWHLITIYEMRTFGHTVGDTLWKGIGVISAYLHFYARWMRLTCTRDQQYWSPLLMGFYPNRNHWFVVMCKRVGKIVDTFYLPVKALCISSALKIKKILDINKKRK